MLTGTLSAATMILLNEATVLYTFYAPLQAHVLFYVGLALVIVGSWLIGFVMFKSHARLKKVNPAKTTLLLSFIVVITIMMRQIVTYVDVLTILFHLITC